MKRIALTTLWITAILFVFAFGVTLATPVQADGPSLPLQAIASGMNHSCGLKPDGSLACWGANNAGQTDVALPNHSFVQVSTSNSHTCGLKVDGSVACWGQNTYWQTNVPAENEFFMQISAGGTHTCALKTYGSIVCWGNNTSNQSLVPSPNESFTQVSAGNNHTCGLKADGSLVCWGASVESTVPEPNSNFSHVSAGNGYTCALKSDGSLACWGDNTGGRLNVPVPNDDFVQVSTGGYHACGLKQDGSVACWGYNDGGQTNVPNPNSSFVQIGVGGNHTCGLKADSKIVCWGHSDQVQTGVKTPNVYGKDSTAPGVVSSLRADPSPTGAASVAFTVTFSEFVVGVTVDNFALTTSGLTGASITGVSGSGNTYTVTASTGASDGSGTMRLDVLSSGGIRDAVNLPLAGGYTDGESYTIVDNSGPKISAITRFTPLTSPTNADSLTFRVTFNETVANVDAADFAVAGGSTAAVTGVVAFSATIYEVTVSGGNLPSYNGEVGLSLSAGQDIEDLSGNALIVGVPGTVEVYLLDNSNPEIIVPAGITAEADGPTGKAVSFSVTASDLVAGDLTPACNFASGATFPLGVTTVTCSATDTAGNTGTDSFTITVQDTTAPGLTVPADITEEAVWPGGTIIHFAVTAYDVVDGALTPSCDPLSGGAFPLSATRVTCSATDAAGNTATASFTITIVDTIAPGVVSVVRAGANPTSAATVAFTVTFSEPVSGVGLDDFVLVWAGVTGPEIVSVAGSGAVYTVTVDTGMGNGTLRVDVIANGSIKDQANHGLSGGYDGGEAYEVKGRVLFLPLVVKGP